MSRNKYYAGVDIGTSTSPSAIGIIKIEEERCFIECVYPIQPIKYYNKKITRKIIAFVIKVICKQYDDIFITIEEAFLQGKANKSHLMALGAIEDVVDIDLFIAPTSVKKRVTGSGKAEKDELAKKLLEYPFDRKSKNIIKKLIKNERWDETDSLAIALCGLIKEQHITL